MAEGRLPIMRATKLVYSDLLRMARAMPALLAAAAVILVAINTFDMFLPRGMKTALPVVFVMSVTRTFLMTPVLIAVHRFVVLREVAPRYRLAPVEPRFIRFFVWSLAFAAFSLAIGLLESALRAMSVPPFTVTIIVFSVVIGGCIVALRLTVLFPAIAVDAPSATARQAFADTRGHFWNIAIIGFVAALPILAATLVLAFVLWPMFPANGAWSAHNAVNALAVTVIDLLGYPLFAAVAARIFEGLADRVLRPPG